VAVICDVDTRLWASPHQLGPVLEAVVRRLAGERLTMLDGNEESHFAHSRGVDRTFVLGFRSKALGADLSNEFIAAAVRRRPDRLVGFAGIDPLLPSWRDDLTRAIDLGLVGVSVSPSFQGFPPTHSQAMRLWERCMANGLPVIVSRPAPMPAAAVLEWDRPTHWDEVLRALPTLTVVFAGLGMPYVEETLVLLAKHERTFAHIAGCMRRPVDAYRWIAAVIELGVASRLLFASGFPQESPTAVMERLYGLNALMHGAGHGIGQPTGLAPIARRELLAIIERDAMSCLGLRDRAAIVDQGEQAALLAAAQSLLIDH